MEVYLARQPIFDRRQKVVAYELLYRTSKDNYNPKKDGNLATSEVISSSFLNIGLDRISRRKNAFRGEQGDFRHILDMVLLYEKGSWDKAFEIAAKQYNLDEVEIMSYYLESLELADMAWK